MRLLMLAIGLVAVIAVPATAIADRRSGDTDTAAAQQHGKRETRSTTGRRARDDDRRSARRAANTQRQRSRSRSAATVAGDDEIEVTGTITSLRPLTVARRTCAVSTASQTSGFAVGDLVEMTCDLVRGTWTLRVLKHEDFDDDRRRGDDDGRDDDGHKSGRDSSGGSGHGRDDDDSSGHGRGHD